MYQLLCSSRKDSTSRQPFYCCAGVGISGLARPMGPARDSALFNIVAAVRTLKVNFLHAQGGQYKVIIRSFGMGIDNNYHYLLGVYLPMYAFFDPIHSSMPLYRHFSPLRTTTAEIPRPKSHKTTTQPRRKSPRQWLAVRKEHGIIRLVGYVVLEPRRVHVQRRRGTGI